MNLLQKIAINSGIMYVNRLITFVITTIISILLIKHLGSEGYGKYSIVFAYLSFFQIISNFGIDTVVIKEIVRDNSKQNMVIGNAIIIKMVFSLVAVIISWIVVQFLGYSHEIKQFIYVASLSMLLGFCSIYTSLFQAHLKVVYYSVSELLITIFFSGIALLLIILKANLIYFIILQTVLFLSISFMYFLIAKKIKTFKHKLTLDIGITKSLLQQTWPIFVSSISIMIALRIDQLILFKYFNEKSLGLYASVVKLTESLNFIPTILLVSVFPLFCSSFKQSQDRFVEIYNLSYKYLSIIIIPIAFGVTLLSKKLVILIYGINFEAASMSLAILIWSEIFVFLGTVHTNILIASGLQKYVLLFSFIGALINIITNLILIPQYGINGAAITSVISYGIGLFFYLFFREIRQISIDYIKSMIKPVICSIPMSIFIYYFPFLEIAIIVLSIGIYVSLLFFIKGFDKNDLNYLKEIISFSKKSAKSEKVLTHNI